MICVQRSTARASAACALAAARCRDGALEFCIRRSSFCSVARAGSTDPRTAIDSLFALNQRSATDVDLIRAVTPVKLLQSFYDSGTKFQGHCPHTRVCFTDLHRVQTGVTVQPPLFAALFSCILASGDTRSMFYLLTHNQYQIPPTGASLPSVLHCKMNLSRCADSTEAHLELGFRLVLKSTESAAAVAMENSPSAWAPQSSRFESLFSSHAMPAPMVMANWESISHSPIALAWSLLAVLLARSTYY